MGTFFNRMDMRGMLAFIMVAGVMSMAFLLAITHADSDIFKMMLGTVIGASLTPAINWYFGSSSGSAMKDEALAETAKTQTATIAAQSAALASSVPATMTTTTTDAGPPPTTTVTTQPAPDTSPAPAQQDEKK